MKTALQLLAGYVLAFIALWLLTGFIAMEWDPRQWTEPARFLVVWLSCAGPAIALAAKGIV